MQAVALWRLAIVHQHPAGQVRSTEGQVCECENSLGNGVTAIQPERGYTTEWRDIVLRWRGRFSVLAALEAWMQQPTLETRGTYGNDMRAGREQRAESSYYSGRGLELALPHGRMWRRHMANG